MEKTYTKNEILNLVDFSQFHGDTEISIKQTGPNKILVVAHYGNPEDTNANSIDVNLKCAGFPSTAKLKKMFDVVEETGDIESVYVLRLKIESGDDTFISEPLPDKEKKVTKKDMGLNELKLRNKIRAILRSELSTNTKR